MKNTPLINHRFSLYSVPALAIALFCFVNQPTKAEAYTTTVTIHEYLGFRGHDCHGNNLYGVNVQHGCDHYYVELLTPMPCLVNHRYEKARVTLDRAGNRWVGVYFDGHTARIHNVTKKQSHSSDFYHNTSTSSHGHNHKAAQKTRKPLFKWW